MITKDSPLHPFNRNVRCEQCHKIGVLSKVISQGWRLCSNLIGGYICSPECDKIYIEANKKRREK